MSAIAPSRHRCLIYEGDPSEQFPVIVPLMKEALEEGRRCLYLGDPAMIVRLSRALDSAGVDTAGESARGALQFSADRGFLAHGFDPEAMVRMLRDQVEAARRDGFSGLWASGDMRWELGEDANFERIGEYEARLEQAFDELPLSGVCQYHRHTVPPDALRAAFQAHRSVYLGQTLHADNFYYLPPDLLLERREASAARIAEWMWKQARRVAAAEKERDDSLRALAELNAALERRVSERTADLESFAHSLSHDLRAPLRAIDGHCQELLRAPEALDEKSRLAFTRVCEAARRMRGLMDALLQLAHLSSVRPDRAGVDLSRLAAAAVEELRRSEPQRRVRVAITPRLSAQGDARLLSIALGNLLANAWKFTRGVPDARIEVGAERRGGRLAFFVRDNGAGFDMAYAGKLFKPFFRLHAPSEYPGHGLGLASVRRVVSEHGGEVWAESAPGKGATFWFTLPNSLTS
jgi:signal transduction histidine kinase